MIIFNPIWHTANVLNDIVEGTPVTIPLVAISTGIISLDPGSDQLALGIDSDDVTSVTFNGTSSAYSSSGMNIFFSALTVRTEVTVETSTPLIFDIIGGKLPKGMSVSNQGLLTGTPMGIIDEAGELFSFTVRVSNGVTVRDRTFRIVVFPISQSAIWNMSGLPLETSDTSLASGPYRILGEVKRGESFAFSIDASHPDGDAVTVKIVNSNGIVGSATSYNGALPPGLDLNGTTIEGVVLPSAPPGRYFFTLSILAASPPDPIPAMIEVLSLRTTSFKRPVKMQWVTPVGSLGTIDELGVSNFQVHARNPNGGSVNYNLLYGTGALPPGLMLNPQTGDIEGRVLFVSANQSYSFTVRASSGSIFADRTFSISVRDQFQSENICEVSLKFQGRDKRMAMRGYGAAIPRDWLYRSGDINFGIVTEPYIHVARGIYPDATLAELDYRENVVCTFGSHAIATVKNAAGETIYEVLYRIIIDPMDQDPFGKDNRLSGLLIDYAQSKTNQKIHPQSIWNMRYDLLVDYGTDVGDILPEWMSQDVTVPGFKTAYAVAYLLPGMGAAALASVEEEETIAPVGYQLTFDRVLLSRTGTGETQFDGDGARILPIYVPSGVTTVTTGRWTGLVAEIFTVNVLVDGSNQKSADFSSFTVIDQNSININTSAGTIQFPSIGTNRMLFFSLVGEPPLGASSVNAPVGADMVLGPFVNGVGAVAIDQVAQNLNNFTLLQELGVLRKNTSFGAGTEIIITLTETTFDDEIEGNQRTTFDYIGIPLGKYIKLSNEFKRYPV